MKFFGPVMASVLFQTPWKRPNLISSTPVLIALVADPDKFIKQGDIEMTSKHFKPGEVAPTSGQYKNTATNSEVTVTKGEPLPPTPKKGQTYIVVDKTKHKK